MVFDIFVVGRWLHQASKFHNDEIGKLGEIYLNIIKKKGREEARRKGFEGGNEGKGRVS